MDSACVPLRTQTVRQHVAGGRLGRNRVVIVVVGEFQSEFSVNFQLVAGVGGPQDRQESTQCVHQLTDFVTAHSSSRDGAGCRELSGQDRPFAVYVAAPRGDHRRVRTGLWGGAVSGDFAVAFSDRSA